MSYAVENLIESFDKMSPDDRIRMIMQFGSQGDVRYFPLLKHAILTDSSDNGVKLAALKRICLIKDNAEVSSLLSELRSSANTKELEPYLSMALLSANLITAEDFERKLSNG